MFKAVVESCQAKIALTTTEYNSVKKMAEIQQKFTFSKGSSWPVLEWITTDDFLTKQMADPLDMEYNPAEIVFLQYTSGSTANPKVFDSIGKMYIYRR